MAKHMGFCNPVHAVHDPPVNRSARGDIAVTIESEGLVKFANCAKRHATLGQASRECDEVMHVPDQTPATREATVILLTHVSESAAV